MGLPADSAVVCDVLQTISRSRSSLRLAMPHNGANRQRAAREIGGRATGKLNAAQGARSMVRVAGGLPIRRTRRGYPLATRPPGAPKKTDYCFPVPLWHNVKSFAGLAALRVEEWE